MKLFLFISLLLVFVIQTHSQTITDIDNNVYGTVTIGTQTWLSENLKTTKYANGTSIPMVASNTDWNSLTSPSYCWFNNDSISNAKTYGALYNWYAVNNGQLCPAGWHVPTDMEWTTLTNFLGGANVAGGKLKETGVEHWRSPNTAATNESGFTALPGGMRYGNGAYNFIDSSGIWWSSTQQNDINAWYHGVGHYHGNVYRNSNSKAIGFSVRCMKDNNSSSSIRGEEGIKIYPNPTTGKFNVTLDGPVDDILIEIINAEGQLVFSDSFRKTNDLTFDISNNSNGVYLVKATSVDRVSLRKLSLSR